MHSVAKITLGIGGVMLAIGILLTFSGAKGISSADAFSVEDETVWSGKSGVYVSEEKEDGALLIFVSDEVRCDEFSLNVSSEEGESPRYEPDWCVEGGSLPSGHLDDPKGWLHMGTVRGLEYGVSYEFTSNEEFSGVPEGVVIEIIEDIVGGFFTGLGGGSCACCGLLVLVIGVIMAIFMDDDDQPTSYQIDEQGRVILDQQQGAAATVPPSQVLVSDGSEDSEASATETWYKQTEN
tara:strand:- start:1777 stop:2487 length:711 start_codon:yes stop_codon:yes gene_type:complete